MALGKVDYGLMGLVGGLTVFISFFNGILAGGIGRYFAINVGNMRKDPVAGLEKSQEWFTTAVVVHTILPTALMLIGYPIGEWAVRHFLTIPPDRIAACVWIWRFVCLSCFLGMMSVPLSAMYGAHQYIAELTIYSFVTTTLNVFVMYYMVTHPGVWLVKLALWHLVLGIVPQLIIALRALYLFPECRFRLKYIRCWGNVKQLAGYTLWNMIGAGGTMLRGQGIAILVNKYFGPVVNAAVAVGSNVSGHANMLTGSMLGAFGPAIYNTYGSGELEKARQLAFRVCKLGTLMMLVFAIPLALEVDEVLRLWLKDPPQYAAPICVFVITMNAIHFTTHGHLTMVLARGRIARYQIVCGGFLIATMPLAWLMIEMGLGVYSIGYAMVLTMLLCVCGRVWFARTLVGMSVRYWVCHIALPLLLLVCTTVLIGMVPRFLMKASFWRVCITTLFVEMSLIPFSWFAVLNHIERNFIRSKLLSCLHLNE